MSMDDIVPRAVGNCSLWKKVCNFTTEKMLYSNVLISGQYFSGKTLVLLRMIQMYQKEQAIIVVLDPCVQEGWVSLLSTLVGSHMVSIEQDVNFFSSPPESFVQTESAITNAFASYHVEDWFPFTTSENLSNQRKFLFDVSRYLEIAHDSENKVKQNYTSLYQRLILQIIAKFLCLTKNAKLPLTIFTDEVKIKPKLFNMLDESENAYLISTVHNVESICGRKDFFQFHLDLDTLFR